MSSETPPLDQDFVARMAHEVESNTPLKGPWRGWVDHEDTGWTCVFDELDDHVRKLKEAVRGGYGLDKIQEHAADIGANAMFAFRYARNFHARYEEALRELQED